MNDDYLNNLINLVFSKNEELKKHSLNVAYYMKAFGESLGLSTEDVDMLEFCGLLHDIGKIYVPNELLLKPAGLTNSEFDTIKQHPCLSYNLLKDYSDIYPSALCHHERYDGRGYPSGCKGESIPIVARITSVCDSFDAMTEKRAYNNPMSYDDALKQLVVNRGTQFDSNIVNSFCNIFDYKIRKLK